MVKIIVGTDRPDSRSSQVAEIIQKLYEKSNTTSSILSLDSVGLSELRPSHYSEAKPASLQKAVDELLEADGMHVVVPEYNGSMPGVLKTFIDHWKYPDSFEHRPVCFVGLGGLFGGLRPVEHLQQVFGYRNSFIYPDRVFLINVWNILKAVSYTHLTLPTKA